MKKIDLSPKCVNSRMTFSDIYYLKIPSNKLDGINMKKIEVFDPYPEVSGFLFELDDNTRFSYDIKKPIDNPRKNPRPAQLIAFHHHMMLFIGFSDYHILHKFLAEYSSPFSLSDCRDILDEIRNNCLVINDFIL